MYQYLDILPFMVNSIQTQKLYKKLKESTNPPPPPPTKKGPEAVVKDSKKVRACSNGTFPQAVNFDSVCFRRALVANRGIGVA